MEVEVETETASSSSSSSRGDHHLVAALEQASAMAKQLPTTTDPSQLLQIHAALQSAHHHLSLFFSSNQHPPPPPPPPPQPQPENSVSSAVGDGEPMQMGDDDNDEGDEHNSRVATCTSVDKVEEKMRQCFIRNKRPKRPLSPSAAAAAEEQRQRTYENAGLRDLAPAAELFDSFGTGSRTLDLIYQFHA